MNKSDLSRNAMMLNGSLAKKGYLRFWHSFTAIQPETQETRTFFIEYFIINPSGRSTRPILGQHPHNKKRGILPSYVCINAGVFPSPEEEGRQLHGFYPISALKAAFQPLVLQIEDNFFSENHISGCVEVSPQDARRHSYMCQDGYMEWDLEVNKSIACHTGRLAGAFATACNVLDTFWHGEGIKTEYRGHVIFDGITYEVSPDTCYGYADKHWGRNFNRPWLQLASCHLTSGLSGKTFKHSALAADGCCPRFLWFPLKKRLLMQLTYTGEDYDFFFSRLRAKVHTKWKVTETKRRLVWQIVAQNRDIIVKVSGYCLQEDLMPLQYEAPDGSCPRIPLQGAGNGTGTVLIYRKTPTGKQLLDTLSMEHALCLYSPAPGSAKTK